MTTTLGERIKQARKAKGLTQVELAKRIGAKSHVYVCDLESGKRGKRLDVSLLARIAHELEVSIDWLLLGNEENKKNK